MGAPGIGFGAGSDRTGVLGVVAGVCALIDWFAIVFTGKPVPGLIDLRLYYLRWRARALAYEALLRDEYPPFGDGDYPVAAEFKPVLEGRNRWSVGFRLILAIPQVVVLALLFVAWVVSAIIGWFAILITGRYPEDLWQFSEGFLRWSLRLRATCCCCTTPIRHSA